MKRVIDFLTKSGVQYFATIGLDEKPKVRPFQFMFQEDGKIWYCTSNQKLVYKEVMQNPFVEICASGAKMSWVRIEAKVAFSSDIAIKQRVLDESPLVKGIYKTADNPHLEVFYLDEVSAYISELGKKVTVIKA